MPPRTPQGIRTWTLCPSSCSLRDDPQNWPLNWPQKLVSATFAAAIWRLLWRASSWPRPAVGLWLSLSPPLSVMPKAVKFVFDLACWSFMRSSCVNGSTTGRALRMLLTWVCACRCSAVLAVPPAHLNYLCVSHARVGKSKGNQLCPASSKCIRPETRPKILLS